MRRSILTASILLVVFVSGTTLAIAKPPSRNLVHKYLRDYHRARHDFGAEAVGCNLIEKKGSCHQKASNADVRKSIDVLERFYIPVQPSTPAASAPTQTSSNSVSNSSSTASYTQSASSSSGGDYANVPGVPSSFAACVALRESTNGAGSSNIYGILGSGGQGSIEQQKAAFSQMYAARGAQPWSPYDGC